MLLYTYHSVKAQDSNTDTRPWHVDTTSNPRVWTFINEGSLRQQIDAIHLNPRQPPDCVWCSAQTYGIPKAHLARFQGLDSTRLARLLVGGRTNESFLQRLQRADSDDVTVKSLLSSPELMTVVRPKGVGFVAANDIAPGTVLGLYLGRVYMLHQASLLNEQRYVVSFAGRPTSVDGADPDASNWVSRVNHACGDKANSELVDVVHNHEAKLALVTVRHIEQGEEISWDYHCVVTPDEPLTECLCGSSNCRGFMETIDLTWSCSSDPDSTSA